MTKVQAICYNFNVCKKGKIMEKKEFDRHRIIVSNFFMFFPPLRVGIGEINGMGFNL